MRLPAAADMTVLEHLNIVYRSVKLKFEVSRQMNTNNDQQPVYDSDCINTIALVGDLHFDC